MSLGDPQSYVLVQLLPELAERYWVEFSLKLTFASRHDMSVDQKSWNQWALADANLLAKKFNLCEILTLPSNKAVVSGQQAWQLQLTGTSDQMLSAAISIFHQTWREQSKDYYSASTPVINQQIRNQQRLIAKGHYQTANIYFAGQWFVGADRLCHLEQLLSALKLAKVITASTPDCRNLLLLPELKQAAKGKNGLTLELYLSLRSPYSYIGFCLARQLSEHYGIKIAIKPVLPMVMRGLTVTRNKKRYIYLDAKREAQIHSIPFKKFTDPVGQGIFNSYQLAGFAEQQGRSMEYWQALFSAVYSKGQNVADDKVLANIYQQLSLDVEQGLAFNEQNDWQLWAEVNQQKLEQLGYWGVPCFKLGTISCWGQDRLFYIEQQLIELLQAEGSAVDALNDYN